MINRVRSTAIIMIRRRPNSSTFSLDMPSLLFSLSSLTYEVKPGDVAQPRAHRYLPMVDSGVSGIRY